MDTLDSGTGEEVKTVGDAVKLVEDYAAYAGLDY